MVALFYWQLQLQIWINIIPQTPHLHQTFGAEPVEVYEEVHHWNIEENWFVHSESFSYAEQLKRFYEWVAGFFFFFFWARRFKNIYDVWCLIITVCLYTYWCYAFTQWGTLSRYSEHVKKHTISVFTSTSSFLMAVALFHHTGTLDCPSVSLSTKGHCLPLRAKSVSITVAVCSPKQQLLLGFEHQKRKLDSTRC